MKQLTRTVLFCILLSCAASCIGGHRKGTTRPSSQPDSAAVLQRDTVRHYRFLDFRHDGSRESFIREARRSCAFAVQDSAAVVKFLDADWGLNIHTDSLERVSEVILITSDTSPEIFGRACQDLRAFLGDAWETDEAEESARWSTYYCRAHFRHLHSADGGWTVIFDLIYPEPMEDDLNEYHLKAVREFQEDVRSGDRERIASHFSFPYDIGYPLPAIRDKDDFMAKYDLLFDRDIEVDIVCSNDWCDFGWRGIACNSGWLLWGDMDSTAFAVTAFNTHTDAFRKAWQEEVDRQRTRVHPSLRNYLKPKVVAKTDSCIFRVDEMPDGKLRLAFWQKGKTMKDRPDYVNQEGFRCLEGSAGYPDWLFVNGRDTVNVGFNVTNEGFYYLYRYSAGVSKMSIETTDYEN